MRKLLWLLLVLVTAHSVSAQTVSQGQGNTSSPWNVKISQTGTENNVDVTTLPAITFNGAQPITCALCLTDTQLRASAVSVNFTNTTLAVTGPLTDAQLRASPVPISGTITANAGSGTFTVGAVNLDIRDLVFATDKVDVTGSAVTVSNTVAVSGPLTDTQLRATPVPVSGTVTANAGSGTFTVGAVNLDIRDLAFATDTVDVSGSTVVASPPAIATAGPTLLNGAGQSVTLALAGNKSVGMTLDLNNFSGDIRTFASIDNGATYFETDYWDAHTEVVWDYTVNFSSETSTQRFGVSVPAGVTHVKMDIGSMSGGDVTVTLNATPMQHDEPHGIGYANFNTQRIYQGFQIGGTSNGGAALWANAAVTDNSGPLYNTPGLVVRNITGMGAVQFGPYISSDGYANGIALFNETNSLIEVMRARSGDPDPADTGLVVRNIPFGTQDVNITNASIAVTGPLTDTQLRATPVPISGTVTANAGTNLNTSLLALESTQLTGNTTLSSIKTDVDTLVTAGGGGYVRQDSTATIAKETGGNLAATATSVSSIDTKLTTTNSNTAPLVAAGAGGYVRQDSTATIAKETGGNLATVKTNTDPLVTAGGGGYVRQDSTATIAKESGGNLATTASNTGTISTNTAPLVAAGAGGYVRQDSTATIAKETGGNLASVKTNTDNLDIALSTLRNAIAGTSPNNKTLYDLYALIGSVLAASGAAQPASAVVVAGVDNTGTVRSLAVDPTGTLMVPTQMGSVTTRRLGLRCNALRRLNCQ